MRNIDDICLIIPHPLGVTVRCREETFHRAFTPQMMIDMGMRFIEAGQEALATAAREKPSA